MSVPRVALVPTHSTALADAIAAAVVEIVTVQGREARYHHLGPLAPLAAWDKWEGAAFIDPALSGEKTLADLYDVAVRYADLSILSSSTGLLDDRAGAGWLPADVLKDLDCPAVLVLDCRGWGMALRGLVTGIGMHAPSLNLVGAILVGVADQEHLDLLRGILAAEDIPVAGCLFAGQGLDWDIEPPGAWGAPPSADFLATVAKQVDVDGVEKLAGQRGFLPAPHGFSAHEDDGPLIAVAAGKGFTPWSRDSIEVLRAAGAQIRRLDLVTDESLPAGTAGLVLAGTLWPDSIPDIAMNTALIEDISAQVARGLPTVALGGGMLLMLERLQDTLGRTGDLVGAIQGQGEILWDLQEAAYVEVTSTRDNLLLDKGSGLRGWVLTEVEVTGGPQVWDSPLEVKGTRSKERRREGAGSESLLCSPALLHLAAQEDMAPRLVRACKEYAERAEV